MNFPDKRVALSVLTAAFMTYAIALAETPAAPTTTAPVPNNPLAPQDLIITANPEGQEGPTRAKAEQLKQKNSVPEIIPNRRFSTQPPARKP